METFPAAQDSDEISLKGKLGWGLLVKSLEKYPFVVKGTITDCKFQTLLFSNFQTARFYFAYSERDLRCNELPTILSETAYFWNEGQFFVVGN